MAMQLMVDNGFLDGTIHIRDDLMEGRVACLKCRGRGLYRRCTGRGLWSSEWTGFMCDECNGRGHWQEM